MHYRWWTKQNQEENWNCNPSFSANSLSSVLLSVLWESLFWTGKSPPSFFQSTDTESCPVVFLGGKLRTLSASLLAGSRREVKQEMTKKISRALNWTWKTNTKLWHQYSWQHKNSHAKAQSLVLAVSHLGLKAGNTKHPWETSRNHSRK